MNMDVKPVIKHTIYRVITSTLTVIILYFVIQQVSSITGVNTGVPSITSYLIMSIFFITLETATELVPLPPMKIVLEVLAYIILSYMIIYSLNYGNISTSIPYNRYTIHIEADIKPLIIIPTTILILKAVINGLYRIFEEKEESN